MDLTFRDTLTRRTQVLAGRRSDPLGMYVCGPTVYAPAHVGHARTYLLFDHVKRFFLTQGTRVHHIQNVTDFEDKITHRAVAQGLPWRTLARREERSFARDMRDLGILPARATPRSSDYVATMIRAIRHLERRRIAYRKGRAVYFDASAVPRFQDFEVDELLSAHAVPEPGNDALPEAEDPRDFVLWKPTRPPSPVWTSPWGPGMPGWHLECFVMAKHHLPLPMDLHGGGLDLIFPHHYAENLVSLAILGKPFSRNFLHEAFVTMGVRKMSKSLGNLVPLAQALRDISRGGLRAYLMSRNYQEPLEFFFPDACRWDEMWREDQRTFQGLLSPRDGTGYPLGSLSARLAELPKLVGHNLGIPEALESLHATAESIRASGRSAVRPEDRRECRRILRAAGELLGMDLLPPPPDRRRAA